MYISSPKTKTCKWPQEAPAYRNNHWSAIQAAIEIIHKLKTVDTVALYFYEHLHIPS